MESGHTSNVFFTLKYTKINILVNIPRNQIQEIRQREMEMSQKH